MPKSRKIKIHSVLMAEDVRQEANGQQSIIGVFSNRIKSTASVITLPKIVFRVTFESGEDFTAQGQMSVISPSGIKVFSNPKPIALEVKKDIQAVFSMGWGPAVFQEPGTYQLRFGIDGKENKIWSFEVKLGEKQTEHQPITGE